MPRRTIKLKVEPPMEIPSSQGNTRTEKSKYERSEDNRKSKEVAQALIFSKHERLTRVLWLMQIANLTDES